MAKRKKRGEEEPRALTPKEIRVNARRQERDRRYWTIIGSVLAVAALIVIAGLLNEFVIRPNSSLATVGDQQIVTREFWQQVRLDHNRLQNQLIQLRQFEQQFGPQTFLSAQINEVQATLSSPFALGLFTLDRMIEQIIIRQEAAARGIVVTDEEVDALLREEIASTQGAVTEPQATATAEAAAEATSVAASWTPTPVATPVLDLDEVDETDEADGDTADDTDADTDADADDATSAEEVSEETATDDTGTDDTGTDDTGTDDTEAVEEDADADEPVAEEDVTEQDITEEAPLDDETAEAELPELDASEEDTDAAETQDAEIETVETDAAETEAAETDEVEITSDIELETDIEADLLDLDSLDLDDLDPDADLDELPAAPILTEEQYQEGLAELATNLNTGAGMTVDDYRELLRDRLLAERLEEVIAAEQVALTELQVNARHILLNIGEIEPQFQFDMDDEEFDPETLSIPEPEFRDEDATLALAQELRQRLLDGEDFAMLAMEYSDDSGSAFNGGDLGWFGPGRMVPEFETAAFELEEGEISQPVRSDFGYHIIQTVERDENRPKDEATIQQERQQIFNQWLQQRVIEANVQRPTDLASRMPRDLRSVAPAMPVMPVQPQ